MRQHLSSSSCLSLQRHPLPFPALICKCGQALGALMHADLFKAWHKHKGTEHAYMCNLVKVSGQTVPHTFIYAVHTFIYECMM